MKQWAPCHSFSLPSCHVTSPTSTCLSLPQVLCVMVWMWGSQESWAESSTHFSDFLNYELNRHSFLRRHPAPTLYQSSTAICTSFALPLVGNNSLGVSSPMFPGYTHMRATRMLHSPGLKLKAAKKMVWVKESWAHKECFPTAVLWVPGAILCVMGTKSNFGSNEQLNDCE